MPIPTRPVFASSSNTLPLPTVGWLASFPHERQGVR